MLNSLWAFVHSNFGILTTSVSLLVAAFVAYRTRSEWHAKQFTSQVNFSLNAVRNGRLEMRTLLETPTRAVWINDFGRAAVMRAAQATTASQPFVKLKNPEDMASVKRAALNILSQMFAQAYLAEALGLPVATRTFYFAVTFERHATMRTRKFRVLIVERQELLDSFAPDAPAITVVERHHADRIPVLCAMREMALEPDADASPLARIELGHPSGPAFEAPDRTAAG